MSNEHKSGRGAAGAATAVQGELVPVLFAADAEEASRYVTILAGSGINAIVGPSGGRRSAGTPLLVAEEHQERASELIASCDALAADDWDDDDEYEDDDDEEEDEDEDDDDDDDYLPDDDEGPGDDDDEVDADD